MKVTARLSKAGVTGMQLLRTAHTLSGPITDWGGILGSELYYGTSYAGQPDWLKLINTGSVTPLAGLRNEGAAALLFIPINNRYMIFSFGYSNQHLMPNRMEKDFGLKVVLNTVDPSKIRSVDSKVVGSVIMNRRTQLSKENRIEDFGFEINKDFLKHVAGKPTSSSFATAIAGSDSLNINTDLDVSNIDKKVKEIYKFYSANIYKANYSWVDNVRSVKDGALLPLLEVDLVASFNKLLSGGNSNLYIACPEVIDYSTVDHFEVKGYRSATIFDFIEVDTLINDLLSKSVNSIMTHNLDHYRIEAVDSSGKVIHGWSLRDWIVYESVVKGTQYIYSEGDWFEISATYFKAINKDFTAITKDPKEYLKLGTTTHKNEVEYLKYYIVQAGHEKIMDRGLSYIYGGKNSIEICDIYNSTKEFIHVKEGSSSSKLSHLFNQGFVSSSLLLNDLNFRSDIVTKLTGNPALISTITNPLVSTNYTVVYRILKKGKTLTVPFFSKIVLLDIYKKIKGMGFQFRLEWIQKI